MKQRCLAASVDLQKIFGQGGTYLSVMIGSVKVKYPWVASLIEIGKSGVVCVSVSINGVYLVARLNFR